jgi:hypothetical protein
MYFWANIRRIFSNVIIDVDIQKVAGPDENDMAVFCRYVDSSNYYLFSIGSDGFYGIWKQIKGTWSLVGVTEMGINEQVINTGNSSNHLKITCNGNNLSLEVNGTILMAVSDSELTSGDVGMFVGTINSPDVEVLFDNFVVTRP